MSNLILLGKWYDGIVASFNGFLVNVVGLVYKFAALALRVFLILANGKLVDSGNYQNLIKNLYIIMGIVMLFVLAFAILKMMVNPDDAQKGTATARKIIINLVTSSVLVALLPTIFAFAFDFQNSVLVRQNTIGRIFGYGESQGVDLAIDEGANQLANGVFTAFFNVDSSFCESGNLEECQSTITDEDGVTLSQAINEVSKTGQFGIYANFKDEIGESIEHNVFLNFLAGGFLAYVAVSFCFDMAVRYIKLIFYQIIAPIPIFCRIVPEGKLSSTFNQWLKITITCYLEVFIRILVFYFSIYLFNSLFGSNGFYQGGFLSGSAYGVGLIVKAFVIMGIVMFMKQAPKLISEITGIDSGNMKLGIREKLKDSGVFAATNAVGSLVSSHGNPLAAIRGLRYGWKNADMHHIGSEAERRRLWVEAREHGATRTGLMINRVRGAFGYDTTYDAEMRRIDDEVKGLDEQIENNKNDLVNERIDERTSGNNTFHSIKDQIDQRAEKKLRREDSKYIFSLAFDEEVEEEYVDLVTGEKKTRKVTKPKKIEGNLNALETYINEHAKDFDSNTLTSLRQQWYKALDVGKGVYIDNVATGATSDATMKTFISNLGQQSVLENALMDADGHGLLWRVQNGTATENERRFYNALQDGRNLWEYLDGHELLQFTTNANGQFEVIQNADKSYTTSQNSYQYTDASGQTQTAQVNIDGAVNNEIRDLGQQKNTVMQSNNELEQQKRVLQQEKTSDKNRARRYTATVSNRDKQK